VVVVVVVVVVMMMMMIMMITMGALAEWLSDGIMFVATVNSLLTSGDL
jgi:hypothetical protein